MDDAGPPIAAERDLSFVIAWRYPLRGTDRFVHARGTVVARGRTRGSTAIDSSLLRIMYRLIGINSCCGRRARGLVVVVVVVLLLTRTGNNARYHPRYYDSG